MTSSSERGVQLWYTTDGDPNGMPLLLVSGLSMQLQNWDETLVARLVDEGYYVIRFDNRDVGLSTKIEPGDLDAATEIFNAVSGIEPRYLYRLSDMATDAVVVLDELGIEKPHVVGASMGGMIVQTMAIEYPERLLTMTSIMSSTGAADVGQPNDAALAVLLEPLVTTREEAVERGAIIQSVIGSPGHVDVERSRADAAEAWDRCAYPLGAGHQLLAVVASPDRTEALRTVSTPTLVIHGTLDPLIDLSGGKATAEAVPGSRLLTIEGMAHDLPPVFWDDVIEALLSHTRSVS